MRNPELEHRRTKAVIAEIVRQSAGVFQNKTNLFKAFWKAHVLAAEAGHRPLTIHPIVKMPRGPGIDGFDRLLGELLEEGVLESDSVQVGTCDALRFTLANSDAYSGVLSDKETGFISSGVEYVDGKTASQVSHTSHEESRSWRHANMGSEIDPVLDSIPEDEYERFKERAAARAAR